jgi:murein DD-endopeptidase MepM/ murein hydrolase activator NlpD
MFFQDLTVAAPAEAPKPAAPQSGHKVLSVSIEGTIPRSLAPEVGPLADALSAEVSRLLVWDLDMRRDLRAGDLLEVVWEGTSAETIEVHALRLESGKLGRAIEAYRFKASGDRYATWWTAGGTEVPRRLVDSPIEEYEQVTSLLKDRPRHKGMDFKADVGVPVTTPREATVTKTNWNLAANGNCAELRFEDGVLAKYLHLSRTDVAPGQRLTPGAQVGLVGNTGRSTGAHLHYQLNRGKAVVDPLDYHGTERRTLPVQDSADLQKTIDRLRAILDGAQPSA